MRDLCNKEREAKLLEMVVLLNQLQFELRNSEKWFDRAVQTTYEMQEIIMDIQDKKYEV